MEISVSAEVLIKSSNVGTAKVALEMAPEALYNTLSTVGFGHITGIELPGEQSGRLLNRERWLPVDHAWLSFGYGLSTTLLQLARAYGVIATEGMLVPVTIRLDAKTQPGIRVLPADVARQITVDARTGCLRGHSDPGGGTDITGWRVRPVRYTKSSLVAAMKRIVIGL